MRITDFAIKNRTSMMVLTVILTLGGLYSYLTIPKESSPSIEIPNIVVTTIYAGASPDDIESLITQKIETEIQGINGIKEIRSTSTEGVSTVVVEFDADLSLDEVFQKVRDKVDIAKSELPTDAEEPIVSEIDLSDFPVMTINLAANYGLVQLKEVGEDLKDELESIPSVLEVDLLGGLEREVQIDVDLQKLQGYNLTYQDVVKAIREENINLPGGSVDVDRYNYLVRVNGEISDPATISELIVKMMGGQAVYVRDVADVRFGFKERETYSRMQLFRTESASGDPVLLPQDDQQIKETISLTVKKRSGENILDLAETIRAKVDAFPFPEGTQVAITGDQSEDVKTLVRDLENNIISGLIFVVAVLLFFLGVRNAILVGIAIPLSMFISFLTFQALGYTLNFVILFSLIIALGMLVDNAIVIVENIYRYREEGYSRFEAAKQGTAEVGIAVITSTATTVAAFVPMMFWPGTIGEFMSFLPLTLIITLSSSLFVAILINPVITGIFVKLDSEPSTPYRRPVAVLLYLLVGVLGLIIGLTNWKTLVVLTLGTATIWTLNRYAFKPIGDRFLATGFPAIVRVYQTFLNAMLVRQYNVPRALLRNTFALGALTIGFILLLFGGIVSSVAGQTAGAVLLMPGALLLVVGILGTLVHTAETIMLGRTRSLVAGLVFGVITAAILGLMYLSPREVELSIIVDLMVMPGFIVFFGAIGMAFVRKPYLILTDNRARLLNSVMGGLFTILGMFVFANPGTEFFPDTDPNMIRVGLEGSLGTNIESSNNIAQEAHSRVLALLNQDERAAGNMESIIAGVGVGGDAMFGGGSASAERSELTLNLVGYDHRTEASRETMRRLREQLVGIPGVNVEFTKDNPGPPTGAPVNIEITGEDFTVITRLVKEVRERLQYWSETGEIAGLVDVTDNLNTGRPELRVEIDRERASQFNLSTQLVANTIRSAVNGAPAGQYRDGEDEYDIVVRLREADRATLDGLRSLTILHEGIQIPISSVASFTVSGGLGSITRLDLSRVATVSADAAEGFSGPQVLADVQARLAEYEKTMPVGYSLSYTGENEEQAESFGFLTGALLIGVSLIFMIMVAQFNRVALPLIIILAVGLSLIGVLLGLILTRTPFGLMTFIGIISLAGIVVNNNIVLIDYTNQLRDRGIEKRQAIVDAGTTRLRPVILTALTTVIGLLPLTFGINIDFVGLLANMDANLGIGSENTQFWGPMGTAIISGLTFATFLTLVIVPVMYSVFDSITDRLAANTR